MRVSGPYFVQTCTSDYYTCAFVICELLLYYYYYHHHHLKTSAFFQTRVRRLPRGTQTTFDDTLQQSTRTLVDQSPSDRQLSIHGYWNEFLVTGINQLQIREETLEFGNLSSVRWISASSPLLLVIIYLSHCNCHTASHILVNSSPSPPHCHVNLSCHVTFSPCHIFTMSRTGNIKYSQFNCMTLSWWPCHEIVSFTLHYIITSSEKYDTILLLWNISNNLVSSAQWNASWSQFWR